MKKSTLEFKNLADIATFSKTLYQGYLLNTCNLTITSRLFPIDVEQAIILFGAKPVMTTDKTFTY